MKIMFGHMGSWQIIHFQGIFIFFNQIWPQKPSQHSACGIHNTWSELAHGLVFIFSFFSLVPFQYLFSGLTC